MNKRLKQIITASLGLVLLTGCSTNVDIYEDAPSVSYESILDNKDDHVFYYFYQEDCAHCIDLKPTMNEFYSDIEGSDIEFETIDMADSSNLDGWYDWDKLHEKYGEDATPSDDPNYTSNPSDMKDISDIKITGTPTMIEVDNGSVESYLIGEDEIATKVGEIEDTL